jgi:WD40 repeat protein
VVGRNPFTPPDFKGKPRGGAVLLYDTRAGKLLKQIEAPRSVDTLAVSPDGRTVAWGSKAGEVHVIEASSGKALLRLDVPKVSSDERREDLLLAFAPDSKRLAVGLGKRGTRLVEWAAGGPGETFSPPERFTPSTLRFVADGRLLAAGHAEVEVTSGYASDVSVWEVTTGKPVRDVWRTGEGVADMALAPDGTEVATAGFNATVLLWGLAPGD